MGEEKLEVNFQDLCQQSREIGDTIDITGCRRVGFGAIQLRI